MTSSTNYSEANIRPRRYRGIRSSKKSILYSDYNADEEPKNGVLGHRSISLTALPHNATNSVSSGTTPIPTAGPLLEPRMAQLETLEAKMASIEVSLSTAQRRKNGKKNGNGIISNMTKTPAFGTTSSANIFASIRSNTLIDTCRELEVLRNALKDKENTIQNLQGQMNCCGRLTSFQPLDPSERRSAEVRLQNLKQEEEARKTAIKKINLTLEQIDSNEANIDVRIKQAELEYELGREELGLLGIKEECEIPLGRPFFVDTLLHGVREEMRTLQARLDAKPIPTLYSCVKTPGKFTLHSVQLEYDPKSPRFGAGNVEDKIGLFVLWAAENSGLQKGDRILEVNGKLTLSTTKEEMIRLLTVCPLKAEIVVFRTWAPPPSAEDFLRRENLRLTHRISYLEDQVSELLLIKENSSTPDQDLKQCKKPTETHQKGSHIALLSSKKGMYKATLDNAPLSDSNQQDKLGESNGTVTLVSINGYNVPVGPSQKYHEIDQYQAFQSKLYINNEKIKNLAKKHDKDEFPSTLTRSKSKKDCDDSEFEKKNFNNPANLKNDLVHENSYSLSDLDRPNRKANHYYCRAVDYSSETNCPRYKLKERKAKSVDEDTEEINYRHKPENSEGQEHPHNKPTPPKKPIRLSINKCASLQSVETSFSLPSTVRKIKRSHKGEAPQPPILYDKKINDESSYNMCESNGSHSFSRAELWKASSETGQFRWVGSPHCSKSKGSEKWF